MLALMRHRPTRRVAYWAAVAAVTQLAITHTANSLSMFIARALRRLAAWNYARKYLLHLHEHAIPFEVLQEPRSPRLSDSPGRSLPSISEQEDEAVMLDAPPAVAAHGWGRATRAT